MRRFLTSILFIVGVGVASTSFGQQAAISFSDEIGVDLSEDNSYQTSSHDQSSFEKDVIDADAIAKKSIKNYNNQRRHEPHIAVAHYREKAKSNGKHIMFMESLGYSIFLGNRRNAAALSNHNFFCESTKSYVSNPKWVSYVDDNPSHLETVPNGGSTNLNLLRVFEERGVLSRRESNKYSFEFFASYEIDSDRIVVIEYANDNEKGFIHIHENTNQIQSIEASTSYYWSNAHHMRVPANAKIEFTYFDDRPFVTAITAWYNIDGLEYINSFEILEQKFDDFQLNRAEYWSFNTYNLNPFVSDNPTIWGEYNLPAENEMEMIIAEIGVGENDQSSGYWFYENISKNELARDVIAGLKNNLWD